jgi:hypothetical protein
MEKIYSYIVEGADQAKSTTIKIENQQGSSHSTLLSYQTPGLDADSPSSTDWPRSELLLAALDRLCELFRF